MKKLILTVLTLALISAGCTNNQQTGSNWVPMVGAAALFGTRDYYQNKANNTYQPVSTHPRAIQFYPNNLTYYQRQQLENQRQMLIQQQEQTHLMRQRQLQRRY